MNKTKGDCALYTWTGQDVFSYKGCAALRQGPTVKKSKTVLKVF